MNSIRSIPVLKFSCKTPPSLGLADSQDNDPNEATKNANATKNLLSRISNIVTMKTSQSNASGKARHPEGSLSTWDFGSSGNDGCFPVTQKGSPKKYFLGWGIATAEYFLSLWRTGTFSPVFSPTVYSMLTVRHTFPGFILKTSNIMLHIC